jgi:hypothetical protein
MATLVIFLVSLFLDINEFDKYRLNSYFSKNNQTFIEKIEDKNLFFSSFNYKYQNYIEKISIPKNTLDEILEIKFSVHKDFKTFDINNIDFLCEEQNCNFFFKDLVESNINIEIISTSLLKSSTEIFSIYTNEIIEKSATKNNINNFKNNDLGNNIIRFNLNDLYKEIQLEKNYDISHLRTLENIIKYENSYKSEVDKSLAEYINNANYESAYASYKDGRYFLISKINYKKNVALINNKFSIGDIYRNQDNIKRFYLKNSNLSNFNLNYKFNYNLNQTKIFLNIIILLSFISIFTIIILKKNKNIFIRNKLSLYLVVFYFLIFDSIMFNAFSLFLLFFFFLFNKKYLKHV